MVRTRFILKVGIGILVVTTGSLFVASAARAQLEPLSEAHTQRIIRSCTAAKASLERLHRTDALLRVNRGQLYESISTKLMARFNGRVALNRLDGSTLVTITTAFEKALQSFRQNYQIYDEALSSALRIDCNTKPEAFYYATLEARDKRTRVNQDVQVLHASIREYQSAFDQFSQSYEKALRDVVL